MTLTEINEQIEQLERVARRLPTLTEALHADRRLAALRARRDGMTSGAVTSSVTAFLFEVDEPEVLA